MRSVGDAIEKVYTSLLLGVLLLVVVALGWVALNAATADPRPRAATTNLEQEQPDPDPYSRYLPENQERASVSNSEIEENWRAESHAEWDAEFDEIIHGPP